MLDEEERGRMWTAILRGVGVMPWGIHWNNIGAVDDDFIARTNRSSRSKYLPTSAFRHRHPVSAKPDRQKLITWCHAYAETYPCMCWGAVEQRKNWKRLLDKGFAFAYLSEGETDRMQPSGSFLPAPPLIPESRFICLR